MSRRNSRRGSAMAVEQQTSTESVDVKRLLETNMLYWDDGDVKPASLGSLLRGGKTLLLFVRNFA